MALRHLKKASTDTLIGQAVEAALDSPVFGTSGYCLRIRILRRRRPAWQTFEAASALCEHGDATRKCVGADILGGLDGDWKRYEFPFTARSAPVLDRLLDEPDTNVILAALQAITLLGGIATSRLVPLAAHTSASVRWGVIDTLKIKEDDAALMTAIALSQDSDASVRDWATFRLGTSDLDSALVRGALMARLTDVDEHARGEAILGLARRNDPRVLIAIGRELEVQASSATPTEFALEAAALMPSRTFVPALQAWLARARGNDSVSDALAQCLGMSEAAI